ncbi:YXWGXW repeat-containing protein [Solimonas flava]|uniref:YXWGXW repeat-containing protein n=1 Tax=Solimonas flava TaxID=415849 RepID=UPI000412A305|nr:YXWGXW repeat-containing protein [Solimonas flava]
MTASRLRFLALLLAAVLFAPRAATAGTSVFISVNVGPPPLPVYEQPWCPGPGYVWTPGYWAWNGDAYYWVPGAWVLAPVGMLWTPGYWVWREGYYTWTPGYWGPRVGYYGGINYGYGYPGSGYYGGYWRGDVFYYNQVVNRVDVTRVRHVYRDGDLDRVTTGRVSFNGGDGGTRARPNRDDEAYARQTHVEATAEQRRHESEARRDPHPAVPADRGGRPVQGGGLPREPAAGQNHQRPEPSGGDTRRPQTPRDEQPERGRETPQRQPTTAPTRSFPPPVQQREPSRDAQPRQPDSAPRPQTPRSEPQRPHGNPMQPRPQDSGHRQDGH